MKQLAYRPFIPSVRILTRDSELPPILGAIQFSDLCKIAGVRLRVSQTRDAVTCVVGADSFITAEGKTLVGGATRWPLERTDALRVLETLAHGVHDYAARECICGIKLFTVPARRGRPPNGPRAKTARERVAAMRQRRRESRTNT